MVIGAVKAAAKPLRFGLAPIAAACAATWACSEVSQVAAETLVGSAKSEPRSAIGSSMDGSVLKNSTPAEKSLMVSPIWGTRMMPVGSSTLMNTDSGPSSERPSRMVNPARPEIENPPCRPR